MKQIETINLPRLDKGSMGAFCYAVNERINSNDFVKSTFTNPVAAFCTAYAVFEDLMMRHRVNLLTGDIQEADNLRDTYYIMLRGIIRECRRLKDPVKQKAAEILWKVTKDFGNINEMKYYQQTGILLAYCQDLRQNHAAEIAELNVGNLLEQLAQANLEFNRLVNDRAESVAGFEKGEFQEARKHITTAYREFVLAVNGYVVMHGDANLVDFINWMNATIIQYRLLIGQGTGPADKEEDTEPTPTPPDSEQKPNPDEGEQEKPNPDEDDKEPDNKPDNGDTLKPDPDAPGEGNGENEDEYTPPDNDGGFGK